MAHQPAAKRRAKGIVRNKNHPVRIRASMIRTGWFYHKSNNYLLTPLCKSSNFATNS